MKKVVITVVCALVVGFTQVNAQSSGFVGGLMDKLSFGVKAEGNMSNFILSDMSDIKSKMGIGGNIGGFIKFDISKNFAIHEDILFSYYSSEIEQNGSKDTYEAFGIEVPIYAMGQWNTFTGGRFYAGVGPYFGMGLSAKMKDSDINLYKKVNGETPMNRLVVGGAAQIGYEFSFGLQINATYKLGITNSLDSMKDDAKMNSQTVSLGIGYRF